MSNRFVQTLSILHSIKIFEYLRAYTPVLAGTIPLGIDTPKSDADIICNVSNHEDFEESLRQYFGNMEEFALWHSVKNDMPVTLASFFAQRANTSEQANMRLRIEIFGQERCVWEQNAVRHLLVEARLLWLGGQTSADALRTLKHQGIKTEPAFVRHFGIPIDASGNPYDTLLELYRLSDDELVQKTNITLSQP